MTRFAHGVVLGKLYPLHAGHQAVITAALAACDRVTVEVVGSASESVPVELRASWVRELHPTARVVWAYDESEIDYASEAAWVHHTGVVARLLDPADGPLDAVFTSDSYGGELARRLGAQWVQVDPGRSVTPVSGRAVRADVPGHWWALPAPVRKHLVRRVVVLGAESTGTTTLSAALAARLGTTWVPEYGREWSGVRPGGLESPWHSAEFDLIAQAQARLEDDAARTAPRPLVICDTDVLATAVWHERYVGRRSPSVEALAASRRPDLYLLTDVGIPFVDDGMRDGEHLREWMHDRFVEVLADQPVPWAVVSGSREQRLAAGIREVEGVLERGWAFAPSLEEQQASRRMADSAHA